LETIYRSNFFKKIRNVEPKLDFSRAKTVLRGVKKRGGGEKRNFPRISPFSFAALNIEFKENN
jgi:hypothetical protein